MTTTDYVTVAQLIAKLQTLDQTATVMVTASYDSCYDFNPIDMTTVTVQDGPFTKNAVFIESILTTLTTLTTS